MDNPLLSALDSPGLPAFDRIRPEHAEPAVDSVLSDNRARLAALIGEAESQPSAVAWETLMDPLEDLGERLARAWGPVTHLFAVTSTAAWREAHGACLPKVTRYQVELSQNEALYRAYESLARASGDAKGGSISTTRQKVIRDALRDFRLSGIALEPKSRARFRDIVLRLSELQAKFQENVIDSAQAWSKHVTDERRLSGMTVQAKSAARAKAESKGLDGFRLTLDFPSYDAVVTYADDRELRRELYEAYGTRASDQGPTAGQFDNGPLIEEILALRHEQAALLGYRNYAELSLATKMAKSPEEVEGFLIDLNSRARPRALAELEELRAFAENQNGPADFGSWDLPYYAEKLKIQTLGFSDDDLRPYFEVQRVVRGMFQLAERLYGIRIDETRMATWHPDVRTYVMRSGAGKEIGLFYLDPYAREDKRGGAWMDECLGRRRSSHSSQDPACYLTCNFSPPLPDQAALLSHDEVVTLFHEFGHGLHHLLTRVDEAAVSGIRGVEWDAVELPSQFMENWCYDPQTLRSFARHHETGDALPEALVLQLQASRRFHAALSTVRQLEYALFDLHLHWRYDEASGSRLLQTLADVRREVSVLPPPPTNRMASSFSHIFGGGYAAGYYSYKWAEVLSADAFAAFEEAEFSPQIGHRFLDEILSRGGSRDAMDLFVAFRGRKPSIDALLKQNGL